jgi:hypothetical protein
MSQREDAARSDLRRAWKREQSRHFWDELGLTANQLHDLHEYLDRMLAESGSCDHSLRFSHEWSQLRGVDVLQLENSLIRLGGACDCEVLANVDPDAV